MFDDSSIFANIAAWTTVNNGTDQEYFKYCIWLGRQ